jgi:NAD(P)-dependent dehydrogenase (short-subunit alcohol dehydrogenase family)
VKGYGFDGPVRNVLDQEDVAMIASLVAQTLFIDGRFEAASSGETPLLDEFMGGDTPELRPKFVASVPLGRLSTLHDIAFPASDEAALITGVALEVDGGRCV